MTLDSCIRVSRRDNHTLVTLHGEIDLSADHAFDRVLDVVTAWAEPVDVDLSDVTFFSAAGAAFLVRLASVVGPERVTIVGTCPSVELVLEVCGLQLPHAGGGGPPTPL